MKKSKATPHNSRLAAQAPLRQLRHGICVAKMLDKTSSIICAFGLAAAAPRSPYRHLELCGIALIFPCRQCGGVPSFCLLLFAQFGGNTKISV